VANKPTPEQIAKLPAWARDYIKTLEWARESAVRSLNEFVDQQKPTDVWIEDHPITGEDTGPSFKRRYLKTDEVTFKLGKQEFSIRRSTYTLNARRKGESLIIGVADMRISPDSSNTIEIWSEKR